MRLGTFTGRLIDPMRIKPGDIDIIDIAHALSQQCRFAGHTKQFYSVAEHSVNVMLEVDSEDPDVMMAALLHDASEAYISDIPTPVKNLMPEVVELESIAEIAIEGKFEYKYSEETYLLVKKADIEMLGCEALKLMNGAEAWVKDLEFEPAERHIECLDPIKAEGNFIYWFRVLTKELEKRKSNESNWLRLRN